MTIETVDMSQKLAAIKRKHNSSDIRNKAYRNDLATLWGYSHDTDAVNDCGVILNPERLILYENNLSYIHVKLVETPIHLWIYSFSWSSLTCGMGYAPSIRTVKAYKSREDSRLAAIEALIKRFEAFSSSAGYSQSEMKEAIQMLKALREAHAPQLALW